MTATRQQLVPVPSRVRTGAANDIRDKASYLAHYERAAKDPDSYWLEQAKSRLWWRVEPTQGLRGDFETVRQQPLSWFADGQLNVTESCLDRHLSSQPDKIAIIWEGDEPGEVRKLSYRELHEAVCRCANVLTNLGLQKGDTVIIYMGMVPEAAISMLACARIGAIHSVVFGGFSAEALRDRVLDCEAKLVITQDEGCRGGKTIALKSVVDEALAEATSVQKVLVFARTGCAPAPTAGRDLDWRTTMQSASADHTAVSCDAEDPLFILYTSGSTGRPKGVVHSGAGYLLWTSYTHANVFDLRPDDVYACMADVGWITGHSYIVYGPLCNGSTSVMFESIPTYPNAGRYWDVVERHRITIFYTAPTAIRALAAQSSQFVTRYDRSSLRVLGTVGEPINPEAWWWYFETVGESRCSIVDTWWQTETGGHAITPFAAATPMKAGSATLPVPGILTELVDGESATLKGSASGHLCITKPWPGIARTVWRDHGRYVSTYFTTHPGRYFTGDGCRRDDDGYLFITGRVDDVLNVAGHRMGTAEFEAALISDETVAEAAVVGYPHEIKGQGVCAYLVLQAGASGASTDATVGRLNALVRQRIGAHAKVDRMLIVPGLPKTRSGKVMRRILRKVAEGQPEAVGDISTLADPGVVESIIAVATTP